MSILGATSAGDYFADCYLSLIHTTTAANMLFNDANCLLHSTSYLCQPDERYTTTTTKAEEKATRFKTVLWSLSWWKRVYEWIWSKSISIVFGITQNLYCKQSYTCSYSLKSHQSWGTGSRFQSWSFHWALGLPFVRRRRPYIHWRRDFRWKLKDWARGFCC